MKKFVMVALAAVSMLLSACFSDEPSANQLGALLQSQARQEIQEARQALLSAAGVNEDSRRMADTMLGDPSNILIRKMVIHNITRKNNGDRVLNVSYDRSIDGGTNNEHVNGRLTLAKADGATWKVIDFEEL